MGEQCLPLLGKDGAAVLQQSQPDVAQGQAHHFAAGRVRRDQTAQAGLGCDDAVPCLAGQLVAAAVTAGGGIADAAGGHQHRLCVQDAAVGGLHAGAAAVLDAEAAGRPVKHPGIGGIAAQGFQHVGGAVALGEDPAAPLGLEGDAQGFKQFHGRSGRESVQRRVEKPGVAADKGQELGHVAVVGQIAAALAGDEDLLPRALGVVFQHRDRESPGRGGTGGHQSGRTAAHNQQIRHGHGRTSFR